MVDDLDFFRHRPDSPPVDLLSTALELLKPRHSMGGGFDAAGPWSIRFPQHDGIKCYAILSGQCWLAIDGEPPVLLAAGDCFVLPLGRPFRLASDLKLEAVDFQQVISAPPQGRVITWNGGGEVSGAGAYFSLDPVPAAMLLRGLPAVLHVRREVDRIALRWIVERMMAELRDPQPGTELIVQHLAQMALVQSLRGSLMAQETVAAGWFSVLAHPQLSLALQALHEEPGSPWTLEELAGKAGMSRSVFALRFRQVAGLSPIDYLIRWRMLLATERLVQGNETIAMIALSLGYESESAFSNAFKRVMGLSPRQYSRQSRLAHGS